jgi:hypothetical protein
VAGDGGLEQAPLAFARLPGLGWSSSRFLAGIRIFGVFVFE